MTTSAEGTDPAASVRRVAILCALGSAVAFTVNDVTIKFLADRFPLHEIVLMRAIFALLVTTFAFAPLMGGWRALRTKRPGIQLLRGGCVAVANMAFFMSLAAMSLADATAVLFVAPLVVTVLAIVFLGEKVGPRRWLAVAIGFAGVLLIVRPGAGTFQAAALLTILAACAYASLHILTRVLGPSETAISMAFWVQVVLIVVSLTIGLAFGDGRFAPENPEGLMKSVAFLLNPWVVPSSNEVGLIAIAGVASATGGYLISQAYRLGEASLIAPFEYAALPFAIFWGFLVFGDWPVWLTWFGFALIVGSGWYAARRDARADADPSRPARR